MPRWQPHFSFETSTVLQKLHLRVKQSYTEVLSSVGDHPAAPALPSRPCEAAARGGAGTPLEGGPARPPESAATRLGYGSGAAAVRARGAPPSPGGGDGTCPRAAPRTRVPGSPRRDPTPFTASGAGSGRGAILIGAAHRPGLELQNKNLLLVTSPG